MHSFDAGLQPGACRCAKSGNTTEVYPGLGGGGGGAYDAAVEVQLFLKAHPVKKATTWASCLVYPEPNLGRIR